MSYSVHISWCKMQEPAMAVFGYARVSSKDQDFDGQIDALKIAGCVKVFAEKISGARADNRKELAKALKALAPGDTLIVTRLDRLARSTRDLLNTLDAVAKAGASFKSLADSWADTTTAHGRLMLTVLGRLAEFERELIKARTQVGIKRAREAGIAFRPPLKLTKHQQAEALRMLGEEDDQGRPKYTQAAVARLFHCGQATISRLAARVAA